VARSAKRVESRSSGSCCDVASGHSTDAAISASCRGVVVEAASSTVLVRHVLLLLCCVGDLHLWRFCCFV